jgi:2-dehydropantoate 2-reductase
MTPQNIGILGPGAIGGLLAARLSKAGHEVTVVATERTAAAIELAGLTLRTRHEQLETTPIARPASPCPLTLIRTDCAVIAHRVQTTGCAGYGRPTAP